MMTNVLNNIYILRLDYIEGRDTKRSN